MLYSKFNSVLSRVLFNFFVGVAFLMLSTQVSAQLSPDQLYGELFERVQTEAIFEDSKTFPDYIPLYPAEEILKKYREQRQNNNFNLKIFIKRHFLPPLQPQSNFRSDTSLTISEHINRLWPVLTRQPDTSKGSLIPLPYPYIVPGGRFREIYYWDSYFTMLGLQVAKQTGLMQNMVDNFSYLIDTIGFIPNGNRTYYLSRSQPPFYSLMVKLLAETKGDSSILVKYLPQLEKEYRFWMDGKSKVTEALPSFRRVMLMPGGEIMNRYWDDSPRPRPESYKEDVMLAKKTNRLPEEVYRHIRAAAESGWDFSSRWFKDKQNLATIHTTDIVPVDLNSLLYHLELVLAQAHGLAGHAKEKTAYKELAQKRMAAIRKYNWTQEANFFMDYDFVAKKTTGVFSLAALYPLFFKIATPDQAKAVARIVENKFLQPGGLITTVNYTNEQWDAPNGWAPLQWIAIKGLRNYSFNQLAANISDRWIQLNRKVYKRTGKLMEKYNVTNTTLEAGGGEYPLQDGFGWTNGVLLKLIQENRMKREATNKDKKELRVPSGNKE